MIEFETQIEALLDKAQNTYLKVYTLGRFEVYRGGKLIDNKEWGRDRTIQLFQFLITARNRGSLHREQIMDRIWQESVEQNFKVALHGVNKALEPDRPNRTEPKFVIRQGQTYHLNRDDIWIDVDQVDKLIEIGNQCITNAPEISIRSFKEAINIYNGEFLPNRIYEDWSSEERERIQILVVGAMINLAELYLQDQPLESVRFADQALQIDSTWEDAYRIKMMAYLVRGNRPMALKTFEQCKETLSREFGIEPLPETKRLQQKILAV